MDNKKKKRRAFDFVEGHKRETRKSYQSFIEETEKVRDTSLQPWSFAQVKIEDTSDDFEGIRKSSRTPVPKKTFDLVDAFEEESSIYKSSKIAKKSAHLEPAFLSKAIPIPTAGNMGLKHEPQSDTDSDTAPPRKSTRTPVPKKSFGLIDSGYQGFASQHMPMKTEDSSDAQAQKRGSKNKAQSNDLAKPVASSSDVNRSRKPSKDSGLEKKRETKKQDLVNKESSKLTVKVDFKAKKEKKNRKRKLDEGVFPNLQTAKLNAGDEEVTLKNVEDNLDHSVLMEALQALKQEPPDETSVESKNSDKEGLSMKKTPEKNRRKPGSKTTPAKKPKHSSKNKSPGDVESFIQKKSENIEENYFFEEWPPAPIVENPPKDFSSSTTERSDGHIILKVGGLNSPTKTKKHKKKHKHHHHDHGQDHGVRYIPEDTAKETETRYSEESKAFGMQQLTGYGSLTSDIQVKNEGEHDLLSLRDKKHKYEKKRKRDASSNIEKPFEETQYDGNQFVVKKRKIYKKKKGEKILVRIQTEFWSKFGELVKVEPTEIKEAGKQSQTKPKKGSKVGKKKHDDKMLSMHDEKEVIQPKSIGKKVDVVTERSVDATAAVVRKKIVAKKMKKKAPPRKQSLKSAGKTKESEPSSKNGGSPTKKKKERKTQTLTAYLLYCRKYRSKVVSECPDMGFSEISKKLAQMWNEAPEKEKDIYKKQLEEHRAKVNASIRKETSKKLKTTKQGSPEKADNTSNKLTRVSSKEYQIAPQKYSVTNLEPVDMAAHLQLLGESLMLVSTALRRQPNDLKVYGSLSVMLDSSLCAMAPLLFLTASIPQLDVIPPEKKANILDNIAYILPGL